MHKMMEYYTKKEEEATNTLCREWGREVAMNVIDKAIREPLDNMTMHDFVKNHCIACGGDWGAMILTGIKDLSPATYEAIPEKMGSNGFKAFSNLITLLYFLGVDTDSE